MKNPNIAKLVPLDYVIPLLPSQHRFMLTTLREFGFGKSSMEEVINKEVEKFRLHLEKDDGSVVCVQVVQRGESQKASVLVE